MCDLKKRLMLFLCEQNAMNNDNLQEIILFFGIFVIHLPCKKKKILAKEYDYAYYTSSAPSLQNPNHGVLKQSV